MEGLEKGITPVVATVLLLFISVALIGTASVSIEGNIADFQKGLEDEMKEQEEKQATSITLINIDLEDSECTIRNTGGVTIEQNYWFIDGEKKNGPSKLKPNENGAIEDCEKGLLEHPQGASAVIG